MDPKLARSLPETTNAEEAMHWKIYAGLGKKLPLMDGLVGLYAFVRHYEWMTAGVNSGLTCGSTVQPRAADHFANRWDQEGVWGS